MDKRHAKKIEALHKLGREQYDTPASLRLCACAECNKMRLHYGRRVKSWEGIAQAERERYL